MQTVAGLAVLVLLSVSYGYAQEESFLGLPVEYDIFGLAEDVDAPVKETDTNADLLKRLCDEYDLQLYDQTIDCQSIKIVPKSLQNTRHTVEKRQAEETDVEGSGEPDEPQENVEPAGEPDTVKESVDETDNAEASAPADKEAEELPAPSEGEEPIAPADKEIEEVPAPPEGEDPVPLANNEAPEEVPPPPEEVPPPPEGEEPVPLANNEAPEELPPPPGGEEPVPLANNEAPEEVPPPPEGEEPVPLANNEAPEEVPPPPEGKEPVPLANNDVPEEVPPPPEGEEPVPVANNEVPPPSEGEEPATNEEEQTPEETTNEEAPQEVPNEESPSESQPDGPSENANVEPAVPYGESASEAPSNVEENADSQDHVHEETTILSVVNEETTVANVQIGRKVVPEDAATAAKESGPENTEAEKLHEHQSGNAILDTPGSETLEGSEVAVRNMSPNENIKQSESDLPKSGESSETEPQQGRKDTKVLVILLVAVVVIGGAAFAYNFIKKRKQKKSEDSSRPENGNAAQKRTDKDPEKGTELKPLMNNSNLKVVEYKDEKGKGNTN